MSKHKNFLGSKKLIDFQEFANEDMNLFSVIGAFDSAQHNVRGQNQRGGMHLVLESAGGSLEGKHANLFDDEFEDIYELNFETNMRDKFENMLDTSQIMERED